MIKNYQLHRDLRMLLIIWLFSNLLIFLFNINSIFCVFNAMLSLTTFSICEVIMDKYLK
jgi:hypothetical protein